MKGYSNRGDEAISGGLATFVAATGALDRTLKAHEQVLNVETCAAGNTVITLPPVSEAAGRIYSITATNITTGTCTVKDALVDANTIDAALTADADYLVLYSDGFRWRVLLAVST